jgi:nucleoside-diphosphate-sugar epimerase
MNGSWFSWLKIFIKGGECAHIVHADDVAAAAMYFISHPTSTPQRFFVSCDHETLNTFAGLWALYKAAENNRPLNNVRPVPRLPLIVPYILRRLWRGKGNRGDVRYSSKKIISKGFNFPHGLQGAVESIIFSIGASS